MPRNKSGSANGGVIGKTNKSSFGKNKVTVKTSSGNITALSGTRVVQATLVAGGASGGSNQGEGDGGGGGGAGGLKTFPSVNACGTIAVVVGGGGALANYTCRKQGNPGNVSSLGSACVTGGGGGGAPPTAPSGAGLPGGSGGGSNGCAAVGSGICGQGNNGGIGLGPAGDGGGGGGAGAVGGNGTAYPGGTAGAGGAGTDISPLYPGTSLPNSGVYAGGGGGASYCRNPGANNAGPGGTGGGGAGGKGAQVGTAGTANTGGGGGGAGGQTPNSGTGRNSGAGGSGIAIIKELNKASGVWSMQSQFAAISSGTWPDGSVVLGVNVNYLVMAGGGGGADGNYVGGGGGAGGYRASGYGPSPLQGTALLANSLFKGTTYTVTVGGGGSSFSKGSDSIFNPGGTEGTDMITATGGGGAFSAPVGPGLAPSNANGGSGGGPNYNGSYPNPFGTNPSTHSVFPASTKGLGNTPPFSPSQGNPSGGGGFNDNGPTSHYGGGGGGGAGGVGGDFNVGPGGNSPTPLHGGDGGIGVGTAINPSSGVGTPGPCGSLRYFGGGGGGGAQGAYDSLPPIRAGIGGYGGGGCASACRGGPPNPWYPRTANAPGHSGVSGESGTTNTGGGGGAGGKDAGVGPVPGPGVGSAGSGGSGIIILRYPTAVTGTLTGPGCNTIACAPSSTKVATFKATGSITFS
jgi:hypothetical protein